MKSNQKIPREYYRKNGYVFVVDHVIKEVIIPKNYELDYPKKVNDYIKIKKYNLRKLK